MNTCNCDSIIHSIGLARLCVCSLQSESAIALIEYIYSRRVAYLASE